MDREAQSAIAGSPSGPVPNTAIRHGVLGWNAGMALAVPQSIPILVASLVFREQAVHGAKSTGFSA